MGHLRAARFASALAASVALAACGGGGGGTPDAVVTLPDAPPPDTAPDTPPPDTGPTFDLACAGMPLPTTAPATVSLAGTTQSISQAGAQPVPAVDLQIFRAGVTAPIATTTSDATGAWSSGALPTNDVPLDGYIRATKDTYRTVYVYPPQAISTDLPVVPVLMMPAGTFNLIAAQFGHDDTASGALMIALTDCASTPMPAATLSVKQGGAEVGTQFHLGSLLPEAAGIYFVFNVPPGATQVSARYQTTTFLEHTVTSFNKATPADPGNTTLTIVRPGPL